MERHRRDADLRGADRATLRAAARPLTGAAEDYDALLAFIGNARFVLLGEASHGTHEFYRERERITQRLIQECGFAAVACEADWPAAYRVNRYVRGVGDDAEAVDALGDFRRFPAWMWRNADVLDFVGWLRAHNDHRPVDARVGFYGIDLYSLHESIEVVLAYLDKVDPEAARRARARYACFDHFGEDPQAYGRAVQFALARSCEDEVVGQLVDLRRRAAEYALRDGRIRPDEFFDAEQNARAVTGAERYYRAMFQGRASSWNLRDGHMAETLGALTGYLERTGPSAKIVVWAHNSHLGDARATAMADAGELNLGQLTRERHVNDAVLVGFTTYTGTVTAARDWGDAAERRRVRPAVPGSWEHFFHSIAMPAFILLPTREPAVATALRDMRLERAIGVIYRPEAERISHYFEAGLARQFDAVIHIDETRALEPLERTAAWERGELPETFPSAV